MGDESVDEGARRVSRCRVHDQARRLVDHDQVGIFEHHVEIERLRPRDGRFRRRHGKHQLVARFDPGAGVTYGPALVAEVA
jgi:hypothetical protein